MSKSKGPVLIELDDAGAPGPEQAPPIPETAELPQGRAMQGALRLAGRPRSALARWFWRLAGSLATFGLSLWAWDTLTALIARNPVLGYTAAALTGAFLLVCLGIVLREWAAFARLRRIDGIKTAASTALAGADLGGARAVSQRLMALYSGRKDMEWPVGRLRERLGEVLDADGLLDLAENQLMVPLDAAARREVEVAARQVAMVTAIVPLALADVVTALVANLRMIRRVAEIYGGRAGALGSWRLARTVMTHLVATGAVAVGDDLIHSIAGGGVLSKLSRRFGEGMINGALTARVGVAAMEVCRPLPFRAQKRPSVTSLVQRALAGLFSSK
jgi:putative membrane protein